MDPYREEILAHWQNPQNFGVMDVPDVVVHQVNPLCGDEVTFYFKISDKQHVTGNMKKGKNGKRVASGELRVTNVSFTGSGCAISMASASMLSEAIKGKSVKDLERITGQDILGLIGGSVAPARLKCAFLALEALKRLGDRVKS